ncbi:DUF6879 family protein [Streptomyces sp. FH025]|uniref:DUF6879 family protein n=1 Tax=Streptomyces sp. FH025 TaxID=2815937 RepID=UPI001FAEE324|nr:DUF6879 family protein [Streptomyces sp. FH025]
MRDGYMRDDPVFVAWQAGRIELDGRDETAWRGLVREATARGVAVRRARIVSEPLSDYTRFEYEITSDHNIAAGEDVRWLARRHATDLALPGNDFWLFDGSTLLVNHFDGGGNWLDSELVTDDAAVKLCAEAFDAVWHRAIPHLDYRPA